MKVKLKKSKCNNKEESAAEVNQTKAKADKDADGEFDIFKNKMLLIIIAGSAAVCIIIVICFGCSIYSQIKKNNDKVSKVINLKETENTIVKLDQT